MEEQLRTELRQRLQGLDIVRFEEVQLTSGGVSQYYIDIKKALGDSRALFLMGTLLFRMIPQQTTVIAGSGYGGVPLAAVVAQEAGLPLMLVRSTHKEHGLNKRVEGYEPSADDVVAVVEDVVTTGRSCRRIGSVVRGYGAEVAGWYAVVWRGKQELPSNIVFLFRDDDLL